MEEKLKKAFERYEDLTRLMSEESVIADQRRFQDLAREHSHLGPVVEAGRQYYKVREQIAGDKEIIRQDSDPELAALAHEELAQLKEKEKRLVEKLKDLLIPPDPLDSKNIIMEIRAGTGGEEAALFAADLFRMYSHYIESKGWQKELISINAKEMGGIKEVIFSIKGKGAYGRLKFESGVHRVQRVPVTESGGRIHTSAATVAVLPEAGEIDVVIDPSDLKIDVFRSKGPGGQSVNTTDSAVRITHLPTMLVVTCQDEKSQHKNKSKALKVLRSRLLDLKIQQNQKERAMDRKIQVGTGDRSAKIRTYNFPQARVTDHRIGLTIHRLEGILDGDLEELIEALQVSFKGEKREHAKA